MVNNFETTGQIQLILVSLDQKLSELTSKPFSFSKKVSEKKFSKIVFNKKLLICEGRHLTFCEFFWKALIPLPKDSGV